MCGWAIVSACTALAKNYTHMVVLRLFLGFLEAPFYPGAIYMLSRFYTKREVSLEVCCTARKGERTIGIFKGRLLTTA